MYDETKKRQAKAQEILEMYGLTKGPRVPSTRETEDIPSLSGDTVEERLRISHRESVRMTRRERKRARKKVRRRSFHCEDRRMSRHHRLPRSKGGSDYNNNVVLVPMKQHQAFHTLFQNYSPEVIAQILNDTWLPLGTKLVVQKSS